MSIHTREKTALDRFGLRSDAIEYCPVPFRAFLRAMKYVPNDLLSGTFLDYGAGAGRALVLAARYYNFPRVVGVEMNPELCRRAARNLQSANAGQAEIVCSDAATYQPPSDTTVFFLFNPFFGETMKTVVSNIRRSLLGNPRRAAIVVCNARNFMAATGGQDWIIEQASGKHGASLNWHVFVTRTGVAHAENAGKAAFSPSDPRLGRPA